MYADDLDFGLLVRRRLSEKAQDATDISRRVYGKPYELSKLIAGDRKLTDHAFLALTKLLEVRGDLLRVWLASYLVQRSPEFVSLVESAKLVSAELRKSLDAQKAPEVLDEGDWRVWGSRVRAARLRRAVCLYLRSKKGTEDEWVTTETVAKGTSYGLSEAKSALYDLEKRGLTLREMRKGERAAFNGRKHRQPLAYWTNTPAAEELLSTAVAPSESCSVPRWRHPALDGPSEAR